MNRWCINVFELDRNSEDRVRLTTPRAIVVAAAILSLTAILVATLGHYFSPYQVCRREIQQHLLAKDYSADEVLEGVANICTPSD
jgi:hypothetical protein